ncbi:hypothetical protein [Methylobacterium sp. J-090]|uniref:hypothetical protein n=1 Tax=Methylobacterium sp. J-090 TaxID=2836666 RepID=UPI001FBB218D|nr:hypothetical protein [Methylobacterium sp. J-090]MCJ2081850.1 hypothetical protein [Methylobacterium sp. J-090]
MIDRRPRRAALARTAKDNPDGEPDGEDGVQIVDLAICLILTVLVFGVLWVCFR